LQVYPNPAQDELYIKYDYRRRETVTAQLIDLSGHVQWSEEIRQGKDQQINLDVEKLPEGMYLLRFMDASKAKGANSIMTYRIVVRR
ncbi:MAG: T9SS type A sorting domain-containing protein, partial [Bacteroidota bacterium]